MDDPGPVSDQNDRRSRPVFISYATANRKQALSVCAAIEKRNVPCWIASRDVAPGENYQEAIVQAIRDARALVLVFSSAANDSDEIKKELSLASRYRLPVMTLRIQDVEPNDAFAYELSTRQWIDAFDGWDKSIDSLVGRIRQIESGPPIQPPPPAASPRRRGIASTMGRRPAIAAVAGLLLLTIAAGAWWLLRAPSAPVHSMTVRLAGFKLLSPDLPATIRDTVDAEIAAAFHADGAVGISTAAAPAPGKAPAYALGGTIQRQGDTIRVITQLTNERSGAALWSENLDYKDREIATIPRYISVDAGNVVRCGLFGASTYRKPLPDAVLRDYMQFCQGHWAPDQNLGRKALVPAQRVVAAVPDFSWGWAAVAGAYWKVAAVADDPRSAEAARASGRAAADRAVAIDSRNSEGLYIKSMLVDPNDWIGRERLLKRAVAARRLDCGCERHQYGELLTQVGRTGDAVEQLRLAEDLLALYVYTPLSLADALVAAGKPEESKTYFDAAIGIAPNRGFAKRIAMSKAVATGDIEMLRDPEIAISPELRSALLNGYAAVSSRDAATKARAVKALLALPDKQKWDVVAMLLADLGADHEAFVVASRLAAKQYPGPSIFWYPRMHATLRDPGFPALAQRLRLMGYWRQTGTRPDVCNAAGPPEFCRMISARKQGD